MPLVSEGNDEPVLLTEEREILMDGVDEEEYDGRSQASYNFFKRVREQAAR